LQNDDHNLNSEPEYDPDDWGAPLPHPVPSVPRAFGRPDALDHEPAEALPVAREIGAVKPVTANGMAQPAAPAPSKRRRGPVRAAPGPAAVVLPHAAKLDLVPAIFSRSALFRVGGADDPAVPAPAGQPAIAIEAQGGIHFTLSGPWPRMRDKAVWEVALEMAKAAPDAAALLRVGLSEFAERLGYADKGGDTLKWIGDSLRRLSHCRVEFDSPSASGPRLAGNLLLTARKAGSRMEIEIDTAFASRLLGEDYQFAMNRARRASLSTARARWMHDFLSTHSTQSRPFGLPYLRTLCGYSADPRRFPADLDRALKELALKAPEVLASHSFDKGTRSSEGWTVALVCGQEKRRFEQPKAAKKAPMKPVNRGGVAL
jgi:hypothetical protein